MYFFNLIQLNLIFFLFCCHGIIISTKKVKQGNLTLSPSHSQHCAHVRASRCRSASRQCWRLSFHQGEPTVPTASSPYSGPFKVISARPETVCVQYGARSQWISVDRIKIFKVSDDEPVAQPAQRGRPRKKHEDAPNG